MTAVAKRPVMAGDWAAKVANKLHFSDKTSGNSRSINKSSDGEWLIRCSLVSSLAG